jgi:hypothetical protein
MMVEGAFIDWSALFMRDVLAADPLGYRSDIHLGWSWPPCVWQNSLARPFGSGIYCYGISGWLRVSVLLLFALAPSVV